MKMERAFCGVFATGIQPGNPKETAGNDSFFAIKYWYIRYFPLVTNGKCMKMENV